MMAESQGPTSFGYLEIKHSRTICIQVEALVERGRLREFSPRWSYMYSFDILIFPRSVGAAKLKDSDIFQVKHVEAEQQSRAKRILYFAEFVQKEDMTPNTKC
jgi:hypothetical protein